MGYYSQVCFRIEGTKENLNLFVRDLKDRFIKNNYEDCGVLIFDKNSQDTHSGGSGCGCIATTFSGYIYNQLLNSNLRKILLIATGALMNTSMCNQHLSIPSIAHAISLEAVK